MNVGCEKPGHSSESKSIEGKGPCTATTAAESENQWGKGRDVSSLGITMGIPAHHTTIRLFLPFKALRQSYTRQLFWVQTTTEIIIQLPKPAYSFLSRRRIIPFASPRKGQNLSHFSLVIPWIPEGTIGTHSNVSWRSILGYLKTIGFMVSLSFLLYS